MVLRMLWRNNQNLWLNYQHLFYTKKLPIHDKIWYRVKIKSVNIKKTNPIEVWEIMRKRD